MSRFSKRRFAAALALAALALPSLSSPPAGGEVSGGRGALVSLGGQIHPRRLFRHLPTPIAVTIDGSVHGEEGAPPPQLAALEIAFGARGELDTAGLPRCPRARLEDATQRQALARCRAALIGSGTIEAEVPFSAEEPIEAHARLLAFNGRAHGRPAVWVHGYATTPPVSFVLPFYLSQASGSAFGVRMRAPVAAALGRWPRLRSFRITLGRRYLAGGARHSYLSASCPVGPRFHRGQAVIARADYVFTPSPRHSVAITRGCLVRE